eukprot:1142166-Pelagomonas_calceolata.AAC.5
MSVWVGVSCFWKYRWPSGRRYAQLLRPAPGPAECGLVRASCSYATITTGRGLVCVHPAST